MAFKLPGFGGGKKTNIKGDMDRKYGTGEYSRGGKKFEERMKPGESKFKYDIRMRGEKKKKQESYTSKDIKEGEIYEDSLLPEVKIEGDLRSTDTPSNYGITSDMDFKTAFTQAGKTAKRGDIFFWQDNPFIYEFKDKK